MSEVGFPFACGFARLRHVCRAAALVLCVLGSLLSIEARAADTDSANTTVGILEALSIIKTKDLDFGVIAPSPSGGTVVLAPTSSQTCTTTGGLVHSGACQAATFSGYGDTGRVVRVKLPPSGKFSLAGPGTAMLVDYLTIDGDPELTYVGKGVGFVRYRNTSTNGIFAFRIGGTLHVNPNQAQGVYSATFTVRIDYN